MAYAEKHGKGWRARYKLPDGSYGSEPGFATKRAAKEWGEEQEVWLRRHPTYDPRKARTPLGEFVPIFMDSQDVALNTVAKRRQLLKAHILPRWQYTPLCDIDLLTAKAWAKELQCADSTKGHVMTLLSMILTAAVDGRYLLANPLFQRRIKKKSSAAIVKRTTSDDEVYAEPDEAYAISQRLEGVARLMLDVDVYTGLRWGELVGLHRDNCLLVRREKLNGKPWFRRVLRIDPEVGALHEVQVQLTEEELEEWRRQEDERIAKAIRAGRPVRRKKEPETRTELFLGEPKNESSAREVDVPSFLVALIEQHLETWPHEHPFSTPGGQHWRRSNFARQQLRPAADGRPAREARRGHRALPGWEPILPHFTMRGARHTHSTWMKEDEVDRALRFQTMGWVVKDIEGTYEHVTPVMRKRRLDGLEARWKQARRGAWAPLRSVS